MRRFCVFHVVVVAALCAALHGNVLAAATLVKDINPNPQPQGSFPTGMAIMNSVIYFSASDGINGTELWKSDGSSATLVKDINPGPSNSSPGYFTAVGSTLFFTAFEEATGYELWKTDGTEAGTVQVRDINPGPNSSSPTSLIALNSTVLFSADDGLNGVELWKSDGIQAGTVMVKDINTGMASSDPTDLVVFNSQIYFAASNGAASDRNVWRTDGSSVNTVVVTNWSPGYASSNLTVIGNTLFNSVNDLSFFFLYAISTSNFPTSMGAVNSTNLTASTTVLYFSGRVGAETELWRSDGTGGGTFSLNINTTVGAGSNPSQLVTIGSTLYCVANNGVTGNEIWTSANGGAATQVKDITVGAGGSFIGDMTVLGTNFFFRNFDAINGYELWKSDGTNGGTNLLKNIAPGNLDSFPNNLFSLGGTLYFQADDYLTGYELWKSNGTSTGTVRVANIRSDEASSSPTTLTDVNGTLYFVANDGVNGTELWSSTGATATLVSDINTGGNSLPANLLNVGGILFFSASNGTTAGLNGTELWKVEGGVASLVKDINAGTASSSLSRFVAIGNTLYFAANNGTSTQVWRSNGTNAGTVAVTTLTAASPTNLTAVNGKIAFTTSDGSGIGTEIFFYDPGTGLTTNKDIAAGAAGSFPNGFKLVGSTLFFSAFDAVNGTELWKTDGTAAGTVLIKNISTGVNSSFPQQLTAVGAVLAFVANDGVLGNELWKSDGTGAGTVLVKDLIVGAGSPTISFLTNANGTLLFRTNAGTSGSELWKSDGTDAGTVLVKDIFTGASGASPNALVQVLSEGVVAFSANDGVNGTEIWKSNGNALDTLLVQDLVGGGGSSNPSGFTVSGSNVFFTANNGADGLELWVMPLSDFHNPAPVLTSILPTSALEGSAALTLTVTGTDFSSSSVAFLNGLPRATTVTSNTQLTASILSSDLATGGTYNVRVATPTPGGGTSAIQTFTVNNLVPTLTSLSPSSALINSGAFTLTLTGTHFSPNSVVEINGSARNTTFVSSIQITAKIRDNDLTKAGTADLTVTNPAPSGGTSSAVTFTINNPVPTLASLSPTTAADGGTSGSITVTGTNYVSNSVVQWNGTARTTTFVSATQLVASIVSSDLAVAAVNKVSVFNPTPGGGTSSEQNFTVGSAPAITSQLALSAQANSTLNYTITATGSNPITYAATNLPAGVTLTAGVLSGKLTDIGSFSITLTATNTLGTDTKTLTLTVSPIAPPAGSSSSAADSDGDGFSDEFEKELQTNELSAASTPLAGSTVSTPESLFITKLALSLAFGKPGTSSMSASGILTVPNGFTISGSKVVVDVGGVIKQFSLDSKGSSKAGNDTLKISIKSTKGIVAAQSAKFSVGYKSGSWHNNFADEALLDTNASGVPHTVTVHILFNNKLFKADVPQLYTAKQGSSGKTKLPSGVSTIPGR